MLWEPQAELKNMLLYYCQGALQDTAKEAHGAQTQVAAASLELECLCQTGRPQHFPQGEVGARSGILGWAHTCHSNTRVC